MFNVFDSEIYAGGNINPARKFHVGYGYDPDSYISTAGLAPSPYLTQAIISSKIGGTNRLIEAVDDSQPPIGTLNPNNPPNNPALATLNNLIQIVTTEINGYLSSIYPIPLAQTGTIAVIHVTGVSTDGLGTITSIEVLQAGNYLTSPVAVNSPAYLRHLDPLANEHFWGQSWLQCQTGKGAVLTATFQPVNYSDESGVVLQAQTLNGVPVITNGGTGYQQDDLLVLTGGSSFVPAKVKQAALEIIFYELYKRRQAPDETNPGVKQAKFWRDLLVEIQEGEKQLDGTYKRFFSAVSSWNKESVLNGANSL